jgi:hypothetical protein
LAISVQTEPPSVDDCHFVTVPILPAKVRSALVLPAQTVVPPVIVPPTETGLTDIIIALLVAGLPDTQVTLEFISTVIISPFDNAASVYVILFDPTFVPVFFH